jgi:hypothetical protein
MSLEQGRQEAVVLKHGVENQTIEGETSSKRLKTEPATEPEIVEAQPSIAEKETIPLMSPLSTAENKEVGDTVTEIKETSVPLIKLISGEVTVPQTEEVPVEETAPKNHTSAGVKGEVMAHTHTEG